MRVLVVGGGGREHALCRMLAADPAVDGVVAAPANAGIGRDAEVVAISADDHRALARVAERRRIDLTVVGPEAPLAAGLADAFAARGLEVFGPGRDGARLEASKAWARGLCRRHGIPVPRSGEFRHLDEARAYLDELQPPYVVKADGLAGGKGVTIAQDHAEAVRALRASLVEGAFGAAGRTVVVEEYLRGWELSAMALTDGRTVVPLAFAQDHKRAQDGDRGPNTGGMGAYSPVPMLTAEEAARIERDVLAPVVLALAAEGVSYAGVVYAGLMMTADGPKVLEFNCRFGDPEAQVVLPRLTSGLGGLLLDCVRGRLDRRAVSWDARACVGVVVASAGYPGTPRTGLPIEGLEEAARVPGVQVFHSGTGSRDGRVITAGGRVLTVTALGKDHEDARERAYAGVSAIRFEGLHFRTDIAATALIGAA